MLQASIESAHASNTSKLDDSLSYLKLVDALRKNDVDIASTAIKAFVGENGAQSGKRKPASGNPLHLAVNLCPKAIVEMILADYCTVQRTGDGVDIEGTEPSQLLNRKYSASETLGDMQLNGTKVRFNWINEPNDLDGQTPLHVASKLGRSDIVKLMFETQTADDTLRDSGGKTAADLASNELTAEVIRSFREEYKDRIMHLVRSFLIQREKKSVMDIFEKDARAAAYLKEGWFDINSPVDPVTLYTILHFAAKDEDMEFVEWALLNGADPGCKAKKGKKPVDLMTTKDSKVKNRLKNAIAQAPIQSSSLLVSSSVKTRGLTSSAQGPRLTGNLLKWTNYATGYQNRHFVLENGNLSYFTTADEYPLACRGSISTLIAEVVLPDPNDKSRFDVVGKGSVRYSLKARSPADAKKWVWAIMESKRWMADRSKEGTIAAISSPGAIQVTGSTPPSVSGGGGFIGAQRHVAFVDDTGDPWDDNGKSALNDENGSVSIARRASSTGQPSETSLEGISSRDIPPEGTQIPEDGVSKLAVQLSSSPRVLAEAFLSPNQLEDGDGALMQTHTNDLQTLLYLLDVQMDVQRGAIRAVIDAFEANNAEQSPDREIDLQGIPSLLESSATHVSDTIRRVVQIMEMRERKLERRLAREMEGRSRWESIVREIVGVEGNDGVVEHFGEVQDDPPSQNESTPANDFTENHAVESSAEDVTATEDTIVANAPPKHEEIVPSRASLAVSRASLSKMRASQDIFYDAIYQRMSMDNRRVSNLDDEDEDEFYDAVDETPRMPIDAARVANTTAAVAKNSNSHIIEKMFGFEVYDPKEDDKVSKPKSLDFDSAHSALEKADQKDLFVAADDLLDSMNGYVPFRQARARLPLDPSRPKPSLAIWSFLKSAIGKDLSRVTLPVFFNEPLSMLQRMAEDVEYIELLSLAGRVGCGNNSSLEGPAAACAKSLHYPVDEVQSLQGDEASLMRLMLVSAFAMSNYSSTPGRINKPFNPMLGETYELVNDEKQYRYISEQVCHHPPISACHCESTDYVFWTEVNVKSKFWGKSLEIHPLGSCHVQLPLYGSNAGDVIGSEHYSWRKVTTCVNNLIVGKMWIDHFGDLTCRNWRTGEECTLTYKPKSAGSWFGWGGGGGDSSTNVDTSGGEIVGVVKDKHGKVRYEIRGNWGSSLGAHVAPGSGSTAIFSRPQIQLWQRTPLPPHAPQFFNFTTLAMMMNELASSNGTSLQRCLPISDSRLRPDQRAMECGQWDDATRWKERLEIAQRERRKNVVARYEREGVADGPQELRWKAQEEIGEEWWIPRWFVREMEPHTGEGHWRFTGEYWKIRNAVVKEAGSWPEWVPDVHDLKTNR